MFPELKQFVPSAVCLGCEGCCRFSEPKSCWRPKVSAEEKRANFLPAKKALVFPASIVDEDQALPTIPWKGKNICYFFNPNHNTCGIYSQRPFECRLYPFVVTQQQGRWAVSAHLACPHIQARRNSPEFDAYVSYLKTYFLQKAVIRFMRTYGLLDHAYAGRDLEFEELFPVDACDA